jgi:hypothetical protein
MAKNKKVKKVKLTQTQVDRKSASSLVNQELAPTIAEANRQKNEEATNAAKQQAFITALTQTASESAKQYAPAVQDAYQTAAQDQTAFGKGYSDAFKQAQNQNATQTNKLLEQSGAPAAQQLSGDTGAADALYGIAGAQPGSTLGTEGAAFTSAAAKLPTITALSGQQYLGAAQTARNKTMSDIQDQLTQVQLKKPGLINDVIGQIQTNRSKTQQQSYDNKLAANAFGLKVKTEAANESYKNASLNSTNAYRSSMLSLKKAGLQIQSQKVSQSNRQKISSPLSKMMGYFVDSYGSPVVGKNGKVVAVPKTSSLASKDITNIAESVHEGYFGVTDTKTGAVVSAPGKSYKDVYRDLLAMYPTASKEIQTTLNMYYKPGQYGRAWNSAALRNISNQSLQATYNQFKTANPTTTPTLSPAKPTRKQMIDQILQWQGE